MEENSIFADRYRLEKFLGQGAYSEVWLATDEKTNLKVALKIYALATSFDDNSLKMFAREYSLVADVNSPNVLKPLYFDFGSDKKPFLVLQYCKNGSTKTMIGNTDEKEAWRIILDVAKGLEELHSHKPNPIVHQDIKPDNIMISDDGRYMITDFGVSVHLHSTLRKTVSVQLANAGTRAYMAPERFGKKSLIPIMASDIWSLGATVFELLSGDVPFLEEGGDYQKNGGEIPELPGNYSETLRKTLEDCLALESWKRPTSERLIEIAESALKDEVYLNIEKESPEESDQTSDAVKNEETQPTPEQDNVNKPVSPQINEIISEASGTVSESNGMKSILFYLIGALGGIGVGVALAFIL